MSETDASGWMPIATAPSGALVDMLISGTYPNGIPYVEVSFRVKKNGHWIGRKIDPPTYWQPLPEPPAALSQDTHSPSPLNPPADEEGAAANSQEQKP